MMLRSLPVESARRTKLGGSSDKENLDPRPTAEEKGTCSTLWTLRRKLDQLRRQLADEEKRRCKAEAQAHEARAARKAEREARSELQAQAQQLSKLQQRCEELEARGWETRKVPTLCDVTQQRAHRMERQARKTASTASQEPTVEDGHAFALVQGTRSLERTFAELQHEWEMEFQEEQSAGVHLRELIASRAHSSEKELDILDESFHVTSTLSTKADAPHDVPSCLCEEPPVEGRHACPSEQETHSLERTFEDLQHEWEIQVQETQSSKEHLPTPVASHVHSLDHELDAIQQQWELEFSEPSESDQLRQENASQEEEIRRLRSQVSLLEGRRHAMAQQDERCAALGAATRLLER